MGMPFYNGESTWRGRQRRRRRRTPPPTTPRCGVVSETTRDDGKKRPIFLFKSLKSQNFNFNQTISNFFQPSPTKPFQNNSQNFIMFGAVFDPFAESSSSDEEHYINTLKAHLLDEEDSDEEVLRTRTARLNRDREAAHQLLIRHYFAPDCVYNEEQFDRRFRMPRHLFLRIATTLENK